MSSRPGACAWLLAVLFITVTVAGPLAALVEPESSTSELAYRHPDLDISTYHLTVGQLTAADAAAARRDFDALGIAAAGARIDARSGRWETLLPVRPLWPGDGVGNDLEWEDLGLAAPDAPGALERLAWDAFVAYLETFEQELRIDLAEVPEQGRVVAHDGGRMVQFYAPRIVDGVPVRGSYLTAVVNRGNLILFGARTWGDVEVSTEPGLSAADADAIVRDHVGSRRVSGTWGKSELILVPLAKIVEVGQVLGNGYAHRLAWVVRPRIEGDLGSWEALVDAHSGELLSFEDTNRYAEVKGGVYPVTNNGVPPDGVEQPGWPMPFDNVTHSGGTATTDSGGNIPGGVSGTRTSTLSGQFVRMNDGCGAISLSSTGDLDFGTSGGTNCVTPGFGGAGNTHSSRTGFHELNRIKEMARGQLPGNTWLTQQLTANMNINLTCNAFWNGVTVNFYRSGGGCANTGEIAAIFDHEWGHGLDDNDVNGTIASPSGEGIADIYSTLRLNNSCIGGNFRPGVQCSGYGDPCIDCTGVRDIDYLKRQSMLPHDYTWSNANCGGAVHCVGSVYAEAVWSLWKRKLQSAPYNLSEDTAHEIVTRMTYLGAGNTGTWFSGGPPNGGCSASSGYMNYLAADDDNGNLNDGTPHMGAIFAAFDDQQIACPTPVVQDSGCAGTPTVAPSVTASPLDKSVSLSWGAVPGASEYEVFRTDGVFACAFGKIRLGATAGTSWNDTGLQNGRDYSYVVIAKGPADSCFGPASACDTVAPSAGPNLDVDVASAVLGISGGDGDQFLDNCENGSFTFDVNNTGIGGLTNVRITNVTSPSHPSITFNTSFPAAVSPSSLPQGGSGTGSFSFTAAGLSFDDTVVFQVEVTADEISPIVKSANLEVLSAESDFQNFASKTFTFESGSEGWQVIQGTFNRTSTGGGAQGTTWYEASSANLDNQCDHIRSPIVSLTSTSTLALWNQFDIEPQFTNGVWYDRANVGIYEVANGNRTAVNPSGGRLYNASGAQGTCGTTGQDGWADAATAWGESSWSAAALGAAGFAGQQVQLDVRYGTDASLNGFGFHFDQVTLTDFNQQVPDAQSDSCGCTSDPECDDGLFCNGAETCNLGTNTCQPGTAPNCDDGVGCTDDSCNEGTDQCDNVANDAHCDDGLFCNGAETCDPVLDCQAGSDPCPGQSCDEIGDVCVGTGTAQLESDCLTVGGSATTVNLVNTYVNPVVVTSAQYAANTLPVVTRVSAVTANSFAVRLQNPSGSAVAAENVCYLVVEEGTWNIDGFAIEAQRYTSTVTDDAPSNWVGEAQSYGQSYVEPVVLGQVMSDNDPGFSVFWDKGTALGNPPSAAALTTGKTVCEDTDVTRADEVVGFVVIEAGHGTIGGVEFEAATGADTVAGVTNAPPYVYAFNTAFATAPTVATVQMAAVDGNNGGWAQVHGPTLATATTLNLSIDEDQIGDTERSHTTEQVAYAVFAGPVVYPPAVTPTVMEWGTVTAGSTPVTVNLGGSYTSPVVVTAVHYANNTVPVVTRISSVSGSSFAVNLQNAGAGAVASETISYLVVEAGVHTVNGTLIEARTYNSTVTDENNSWVGQAQTLTASFTNPVVLGQVMSTNDADWSVFWDQGTARTNPPIATALTTGKTVCEDTLTTRADETVGYVVIEAGHGTLGGVEFEAALGADTVLGVGNAPPYAYTFGTAFASAPSVAVVTMAGVDGGNGGWAYVFGPAPLSTTSLALAIDEDTIGDAERAHINEQVGYVVFAAPGSASP